MLGLVTVVFAINGLIYNRWLAADILPSFSGGCGAADGCKLFERDCSPTRNELLQTDVSYLGCVKTILLFEILTQVALKITKVLLINFVF